MCSMYTHRVEEEEKQTRLLWSLAGQLPRILNADEDVRISTVKLVITNV